MSGMVQGFCRAAAPLLAYYAIAIGLPLANGARGHAFVKHALVVALIPPMMIVIGVISATTLAWLARVTAASVTRTNSPPAGARRSR